MSVWQFVHFSDCVICKYEHIRFLLNNVRYIVTLITVLLQEFYSRRDVATIKSGLSLYDYLLHFYDQVSVYMISARLFTATDENWFLIHTVIKLSVY